jgi:hypothetical protein
LEETEAAAEQLDGFTLDDLNDEVSCIFDWRSEGTNMVRDTTGIKLWGTYMTSMVARWFILIPKSKARFLSG